MKKTLYFSLLIVAFLSVSCNSFLEDKDLKRQQEEDQAIQNYAKKINLSGFQKSESGLYYLITKKNVQASARNTTDGDEVTMHYTASILDGAKYDSTKSASPIVFPFNSGILPFYGFYEAITLLKNGEKGIFLVPSRLAYGGSSNAIIQPYSMIRLDIEVLKLRSEDEQIEDYIKENKLSIDEKTSTGLRYISITKNSTGVAMNKGRAATVKYIGTFLSGKTFDSGQFDTVIGEGSLIKGFDEALLKMRVGEKAKVIIPSSIGYGAKGSGTILPYTPLVFEIEIVK